jgi:hypothetical protein
MPQHGGYPPRTALWAHKPGKKLYTGDKLHFGIHYIPISCTIWKLEKREFKFEVQRLTCVTHNCTSS